MRALVCKFSSFLKDWRCSTRAWCWAVRACTSLKSVCPASAGALPNITPPCGKLIIVIRNWWWAGCVKRKREQKWTDAGTRLRFMHAQIGLFIYFIFASSLLAFVTDIPRPEILHFRSQRAPGSPKTASPVAGTLKVKLLELVVLIETPC